MQERSGRLAARRSVPGRLAGGQQAAGGLRHPPQPVLVEPSGPDGRAERREAGLARGGQVELPERHRRREQRPDRARSGVGQGGRPRPEPVGRGLLQPVQRPEFGGGEQVGDPVRRARREMCRGRGQRPPGPLRRVGAECGGAFQERGRGGPAAARQGPVRRPFQRGGDRFVRTDRRVGEVPGAPVGVALGVGGVGEGAVHRPQVRGLGAAPDRRAHQRVPEPHRGAQLEQPGGHGGRRRLGSDAQRAEGAPQQQLVADRLDRREQQQGTGVGGQRVDTPTEPLLDPGRHGSDAVSAEAEGQFRRRQPLRQFEQRERVPAGLGDDPVPHPGVDRTGQHRAEQGPGVRVGQPPQRQARQIGEIALPVGEPFGEDQRHRFGVQPPADEPQDPQRHQVQPLRVVDQAHQRAPGRRLGEQSQHRHPDQQQFGHGPAAQAERHPQRVLLDRWQYVQVRQQRGAEPLQARVRELRLGLDTLGADHPQPRRPGGHVVEQRGLADPRPTAQHHHPAPPVAHLAQQPLQRLRLPLPPEQPARRVLFHHASSAGFPLAETLPQELRPHPTNSAPPGARRSPTVCLGSAPTERQGAATVSCAAGVLAHRRIGPAPGVPGRSGPIRADPIRSGPN